MNPKVERWRQAVDWCKQVLVSAPKEAGVDLADMMEDWVEFEAVISADDGTAAPDGVYGFVCDMTEEQFEALYWQVWHELRDEIAAAMQEWMGDL